MARDLDATRRSILEAAEAVFAEFGYDRASLQRIASAAGVSRGMPGYAFGSKAQLYEAVLERALAQPRALAAQFAASGGEGGDVLADGVAAYIEFLARHPTYVRLLQRAALDGRGLHTSAAHRSALAEALPLVDEMVPPAKGHDQRHVLVSVLALCFFPFAHRETLLGPLGIDVGDPAFAGALTTHVVGLLRHGLGQT